MNFAAFLLATSMLTGLATGGDATKKSKVCAMKNWPECALEQTELPASNFSVLATSVAPAGTDILVTLKVYRNQCPTLDMTELKWYRLEALAAGTNVSIGRFVEPIQSQRLETYSCQNDSTIVFATCEPHPLDLPRQYTWKLALADVITGNEVTCFRLTVVDNDEETCKYTEVCVSLLNPFELMVSGSGEEEEEEEEEDEEAMASSQLGSGAFGESVNITEKCYQRWDCSNARMRLFCGSDGNTYTSRCHIRLVECLTDTDISIDHAGQCEEIQAPVCHTMRETLKEVFAGIPEDLYWLPTCDCDGLFKPKQCDRDLMNPGHLECWCSYSNSISEVANTRRKIIDTCRDPSKFEFSCSTL